MTEYERGKREGILNGLQRAWRFVQEEHEERIARSCAAGYNATGIIKKHIEAEIAKIHTEDVSSSVVATQQKS